MQYFINNTMVITIMVLWARPTCPLVWKKLSGKNAVAPDFTLCARDVIQAIYSIFIKLKTLVFLWSYRFVLYRIQQQKIVNGKPEYSGMLDVVSTLVRTEGITALWKGWPFYYLRVAPATVLLFIFMEQLNKGYRKYVMKEEPKI